MDRDALRQQLDESDDVARTLHSMSEALCAAFGADRMTVYVFSEQRDTLKAIVQSGLDPSGRTGRLTIPADPHRSIAGFAAGVSGVVNIRDAYDDAELGRFDPPVAFLRAVDATTGYHTRQLLTVRIPGPGSQPLGVLQFINRRDGSPFPKSCEGDIAWLAGVLGQALAAKPAQPA